MTDIIIEAKPPMLGVVLVQYFWILIVGFDLSLFIETVMYTESIT